MDNQKECGALPKLLSEAILQLCRVGVGLRGSFIIDGIICIDNVESDSQEVVVKIHEKICGGILQPNTSQNQVDSSLSHTNSSNTISSRKGNAYGVNNTSNGYATEVSNQTVDPQVFMNACPGQNTSFSGKQANFPYLHDSDCEILDDTTHKELFGELGSICETDLGGLYDVDFGDVAIKPDPARSKNTASPFQISQTSNAIDENSDDELTIEKQTAGRVRKPHKARNSYKDVHGASVQVLSFEEYSRTLKSEKLKRGRDRSPDFISSKRVLKSTQDQFGYNQQSNIISQAYVTANSDQIASVYDTNIASIRSLSNVPNSTLNSYASRNANIATKVVSTATNNEQCSASVLPLSVYANVSSAKSLNGKRMASKPKEAARKTYKDTTKSVQRGVAPLNEVDNNTGGKSGVQIMYRNANYSADNNEVVDFSSNGVQLSSNDSATNAQVSPSVGAVETVTTESATSSKSLVCFDDFKHDIKSKAPHKCPCCNSVYKSFQELDRHMHREHEGKFMCPICGKILTQRSTRNRHIVAVHSGAKNFSCNLCNASFTRIDSIRKHYKSQHPNLEVPKCSFSYMRGESTAPTEPQVVYMQDIDTSDVRYIPENYVSQVCQSSFVQDVIVQNVIPTNLVVENPTSSTTETSINSVVGNPTNLVVEHSNASLSASQLVSVDENNTSSIVMDGQNVTLEPVSSNVVLEAIQSSNNAHVLPTTEITSLALNTQQSVDQVSTVVNIIKSASTSSLLNQHNSQDCGSCEIISSISNDCETNIPQASNIDVHDTNSNMSVTLVVEEENGPDSPHVPSTSALALSNTDSVVEGSEHTESNSIAVTCHKQVLSSTKVKVVTSSEEIPESRDETVGGAVGPSVASQERSVIVKNSSSKTPPRGGVKTTEHSVAATSSLSAEHTPHNPSTHTATHEIQDSAGLNTQTDSGMNAEAKEQDNTGSEPVLSLVNDGNAEADSTIEISDEEIDTRT